METDQFLELVKAGETAQVEALLRQDPSLAELRDESGVSALMLARYHGRIDTAAALRRRRGALDVFEAATFGDIDRLRELLGGDATLVAARSPDDGTPLHFAAFFAQPAAARLLLERGAELEAVSPTFGNVTPLHSAAAGRSNEIVGALLEAGADPSARQSGGFAPLHAAAQLGDVEMARALLAHGADPTAANDDGRTAISIAEQEGHEELAALLRASG